MAAFQDHQYCTPPVLIVTEECGYSTVATSLRNPVCSGVPFIILLSVFYVDSSKISLNSVESWLKMEYESTYSIIDPVLRNFLAFVLLLTVVVVATMVIGTVVGIDMIPTELSDVFTPGLRSTGEDPHLH